LKLLLGLLVAAVTCLCSPPVVPCTTAPSRFRSETIRSRSLRAYTVTQAHISAKWGCANTACLYVAAQGQPFHVVYTMTPLRSDDTGSSLRPIAWSPDGSLLAIEALYRPQTGSDAAALGLLLFNARSGRTEEVNSDFSSAVSKTKHSVCAVELRAVVGFDESGKVILKLADVVDEEQQSHVCIGKDSMWLLDPETEHLLPAATVAHR